MKIAICSVPLRSGNLKTTYPPLGALAVIQSLQASGYEAAFYDINVFRYSEEDMKEYFLKNKFDVVGISATVSTSYKFVKNLSSLIRAVSPDAAIVAGGALTASSEILLKFTEVDFCVIGEGEKVIVNLVKYIAANERRKRETELKRIKGICFLDSASNAVFTGYEEQMRPDEVRDADYGIIEKYSRIENYIISPFFYEQFKHDKRAYEPHRAGKKLATVVSSRGCVNRCTFCHRWQRGIRVFSVDRVINYIKFLKERYGVGFISFGDEDFGATKKWIEEFIDKIKPLDVIYRISGACADNVDLALLKKLSDSGCVSIHYGFESGSDKILRVMEKKADVDLNVKTAMWTHEAGLQTVYALVVGMPGESYQTISETGDFIKRIAEFLPEDPILSINALVVLPGAPVYEYARYRGLLGRTLEDEERYLSRVSDRGGGSLKQLNLTDYPYFVVHSWIRCLYWTGHYYYYKKNGLPRIPALKLFKRVFDIASGRGSHAKGFQESPFSHPLFYHSRHIVSLLLVMLQNFKEDKRLFFRRCVELLVWPFKRKTFTEYLSVRSFLNGKMGAAEAGDSIRILRSGR